MSLPANDIQGHVFTTYKDLVAALGPPIGRPRLPSLVNPITCLFDLGDGIRIYHVRDLTERRTPRRLLKWRISVVTLQKTGAAADPGLRVMLATHFGMLGPLSLTVSQAHRKGRGLLEPGSTEHRTQWTKDLGLGSRSP